MAFGSLAHTFLWGIDSRFEFVLQGATAVSAYVTHAVFPNNTHTRFSDLEGTPDSFAHFWVTDSCPNTVQALANKRPFEIISLAGPIAAALRI